jgi:hypothetical protein
MVEEGERTATGLNEIGNRATEAAVLPVHAAFERRRESLVRSRE